MSISFSIYPDHFKHNYRRRVYDILPLLDLNVYDILTNIGLVLSNYFTVKAYITSCYDLKDCPQNLQTKRKCTLPILKVSIKPP